MRLVLDTNVVLDCFLFRDPLTEAIVAALESGAAVALSQEDCLEELDRVLERPRFARYESRAVVARYAAVIELVPRQRSADLPRCQDLDDQKFLEVAHSGRADFLVTKDKALLKLRRKVARLGCFRIVAPAWLNTRSMTELAPLKR